MLLQLTILFYGKDIFHFDDRHSTYLQGGMLLGVGAGSLAAGFLSGGKIEYGLIPLGMARLDDFFRAAFPMPGSASPPSRGASACSVSSADFTTCRSTPSSNTGPTPDNKGKVIAAAALLSWIGILLASGVYYLLTVVWHLKPPQIFLFGAVLSLAGTVYCIGSCRIRCCGSCSGARRIRSTAFASWAATTSRKKAARCLSATTLRLWMRCCCWPPPTGKSAS